MPSARHLYLTGYRGTGKSSVGAAIAGSLDCPVIDLDDVIESDAEKSIAEIFEQGGESLFRDLESKALKRVSREPQAVVALGGGAILREENRKIIRETGACFWLDAEAETIAERISEDAASGDRRPALTTLDHLDEIRELLAQRRGFYEQASDCRIETTGKTLQQVADEVLRRAQDRNLLQNR